jgi:hypothetical protein
MRKLSIQLMQHISSLALLKDIPMFVQTFSRRCINATEATVTHMLWMASLWTANIIHLSVIQPEVLLPLST